MANTYNNQNLLQDSVVFGTFTNCDDIKSGGNQANAKFKRNVFVGGDLTLGLETSITTNGVTTYTDISGNIKFKLNGVSYTITPTMLKYLSTITSDYATTISNITTQISNISIPDLLNSTNIWNNYNNYFNGNVIKKVSNGTLEGVVKLGYNWNGYEKGMYFNYEFSSNDDIGGRGVIQAEYQNSYYTPLCLNPNGGSVGIGTFSPNKKLDVNGSLNATSIYENGIALSSIYAPISSSIYCELGGNYEPVDIVATPSLQANTQARIFDKTYTNVNDIFGYQVINSGGLQGSVKYYNEGNFRNYVVSGYDKSLYGFNTLTGNWKCPQSGKYNICITFYIKSNNGGNKFSLNKYDSSNTLLSSQYCLVGDTISTDTLRTFTTILPMNKDEYFKIVLTTFVGNAVMRFEGMQYSSMKIMLLG